MIFIYGKRIVWYMGILPTSSVTLIFEENTQFLHLQPYSSMLFTYISFVECKIYLFGIGVPIFCV